MRQDEVEEEIIGHSWKQLSKSNDGLTYIRMCTICLRFWKTEVNSNREKFIFNEQVVVEEVK